MSTVQCHRRARGALGRIGCTGTCRSGLSPGGPGAADRPRGSCWPGGNRLAPPGAESRTVGGAVLASVPDGDAATVSSFELRVRSPRVSRTGAITMTATRVADPAGLLGESLAEASAGRNPGRRGSARVSTTWPPPAGPGPEGRVRHPGRAPVPPPAEPGPAGSSLAQCCAGPGVHVHRVRQARASWGHEPHRVLSVQRRCCPPDLPGRSTHTLRVPEAMGPKAIRPARPRARRRPRGPHGPRRRKESP